MNQEGKLQKMQEDFYNKKQHTIKANTPILKKDRSTPAASKYRSKVQIMYDIMLPLSKYERLTSLHYSVEYEGMTKTQIMYKSALSYAQINEYIKMLIENELIKIDGNTNRFNLTEKGYNFVKKFDELAELCPEIKSIYY